MATAVAAIAVGTASQASAAPVLPSSATPVRTATTTSYTTTTYLQDIGVIPSTDNSPAITPVTYDEFQWLLGQSGNFAILIGDPAEDPNFKARAKDVEAAAETDGVKNVYWFDPNLSGNAVVGSTTEPNLDIRVPAGITSLTAKSQEIYGNSWYHLISDDLGDGVAENWLYQGQEGYTVQSVALGAAGDTSPTYVYGTSSKPVGAVGWNDQGNDEIANGVVEDGQGADPSSAALFDYSGQSAVEATVPNAAVSDSYFLIYNKNNLANAAPQTIESWINLDTETSDPVAQADIATAIGTVGGASAIASYSQFQWWLSALDTKAYNNGGSAPTSGGVSPAPAGFPTSYLGLAGIDTLLAPGDGDAAEGGTGSTPWRVDQVTYPELVDLLKQGATTSNAAILFGGTWCPNTRPVLPYINEYAQQNNVEVFNFDTVLDGGTVGGSTTSQSNPLQTRNYASASGSTGDTQDNPTFLYGDLISTYLDNLETEYDPTLATGHVSYYPGGSVGGTGTPAAPAVAQQQVRKLQVPYLIGYQHGASQVSGLGDGGGSGGVTRQWIDPETDVNGLEYFKEYMTDWQYAAAQQNELGLATLPQDADIWDTINSELSNLTWQTNPASLAPNSAIDTDDAEYLDATDQATLSYNTGATPSLSVASGTSHSGTPTSYTTVPISPTALSNALAALGSAAPANYAGAKAALLAAIAGDADNGTSTALSDANLANLETVYGAWGVAQTRKNTVANVWPNVVFAQQAIHALDLFFGGFAGAQVTTQTVTANPFTAGTAGQVNVAIDSPYGAVPTGDVDLAVTQNGTTVYAASQAVAGNNASFTLPTNLAAGTYGYSVSYGADSEILGFSDTGSLTVDPAPDVPPPPPVTPPAPPVSQPAPPVSQPETPVSQPETPAVQSTAPAKATAAAKVHAKKVTGSVAKVTTTKVAGKYKVTVTAAAHKATPTGKITIKLKNGKRTKTLTGRLVRGSVTVAVPKLAKGTWKVTISWPGDSHYLSASAAGAVIRVTK